LINSFPKEKVLFASLFFSEEKAAMGFKPFETLFFIRHVFHAAVVQRSGGFSMAEENIVFVGKKGTMSYVLAVVTQINQGANEVYVKARGKAISRAVDVAEIVKNKFVTDAKIADIKISTEEIPTEEGSPMKLSAIEIRLKK
jgi:DNA-binding protein